MVVGAEGGLLGAMKKRVSAVQMDACEGRRVDVVAGVLSATSVGARLRCVAMDASSWQLMTASCMASCSTCMRMRRARPRSVILYRPLLTVSNS